MRYYCIVVERLFVFDFKPKFQYPIHSSYSHLNGIWPFPITFTFYNNSNSNSDNNDANDVL